MENNKWEIVKYKSKIGIDDFYRMVGKAFIFILLGGLVFTVCQNLIVNSLISTIPEPVTKQINYDPPIELNIVPVDVSNKVKDLTDYQIAMWLLKSCESFHPKAYWDVTQWTIGWGTKSTKGETITLAEANKRTAKEYDRVYNDLHKRFPNVSRWDLLILAVMDYNVGAFGPNLEAAIKSNDRQLIVRYIKKYVYDSKGVKREGLINRRNKEAKLYMANKEQRQIIGQQLRKEVIKHITKNN